MMDKTKSYFKGEFELKALELQHPQPSDFYLSGWQRTRSAVPMLFWRTFLFLFALGIVLASMALYGQHGLLGFWFIYLTHWGLTSILFTTGFSVLISARCYLYGPISAEFSLPWYVRTFWVLQNIAAPIAFLITIFYWAVLYEAGIEEEFNFGLDIAVHALNSVVMLLLLLTTANPTRIVHVYQPLCFALCYVAFSVIYYLAGGVDTKGNPWVYPVVNWANPGTTVGVCAVVGLLLIVLHLLTVAIVLARDAVAEKLKPKSEEPRNPNEGYPLF